MVWYGLVFSVPGWTVCQLSIIDVRPTSSECLTDTSFLFLSRLERGQSPLVAHLPMVRLLQLSARMCTLCSRPFWPDIMTMMIPEYFRRSLQLCRNKSLFYAMRQTGLFLVFFVDVTLLPPGLSAESIRWNLISCVVAFLRLLPKTLPTLLKW